MKNVCEGKTKAQKYEYQSILDTRQTSQSTHSFLVRAVIPLNTPMRMSLTFIISIPPRQLIDAVANLLKTACLEVYDLQFTDCCLVIAWYNLATSTSGTWISRPPKSHPAGFFEPSSPTQSACISDSNLNPNSKSQDSSIVWVKMCSTFAYCCQAACPCAFSFPHWAPVLRVHLVRSHTCGTRESHWSTMNMMNCLRCHSDTTWTQSARLGHGDLPALAPEGQSLHFWSARTLWQPAGTYQGCHEAKLSAMRPNSQA